YLTRSQRAPGASAGLSVTLGERPDPVSCRTEKSQCAMARQTVPGSIRPALYSLVAGRLSRRTVGRHSVTWRGIRVCLRVAWLDRLLGYNSPGCLAYDY